MSDASESLVAPAAGHTFHNRRPRWPPLLCQLADHLVDKREVHVARHSSAQLSDSIHFFVLLAPKHLKQSNEIRPILVYFVQYTYIKCADSSDRRFGLE